MGHCQLCFLSSSEVPRTPLTLRNPLVEVAFVGGFVCSAALASVAVLGLLLCAQSPLLSAGMVSSREILFSLSRVPQIPFGVTRNWPLENASLIPRAVDLRNWLQTSRRLFLHHVKMWTWAGWKCPSWRVDSMVADPLECCPGCCVRAGDPQGAWGWIGNALCSWGWSKQISSDLSIPKADLNLGLTLVSKREVLYLIRFYSQKKEKNSKYVLGFHPSANVGGLCPCPWQLPAPQGQCRSQEWLRRDSPILASQMIPWTGIMYQCISKL